jgi:cobalamin biosynthesis Mg chelatase CobN
MNSPVFSLTFSFPARHRLRMFGPATWVVQQPEGAAVCSDTPFVLLADALFWFALGLVEFCSQTKPRAADVRMVDHVHKVATSAYWQSQGPVARDVASALKQLLLQEGGACLGNFCPNLADSVREGLAPLSGIY